MELTTFIQEFFGDPANFLPLSLIIPAGCLMIVLLFRRTSFRSPSVLAGISGVVVTAAFLTTYLFGTVHSEMALDVMTDPHLWIGVTVTTLLAMLPLWLFARFIGSRLSDPKSQ